MRFNSKTMPDRVKRLMPIETRKEMKIITSDEAQTKLNGKREKELQDNIANLLRQRGIWFTRQRMDKRATGTLGQPDFLFAFAGRAVGFEVKTHDGKLSDDQKKCHEAMNENGWIVWVVRSEEDVVYRLNLLALLDDNVRDKFNRWKP